MKNYTSLLFYYALIVLIATIIGLLFYFSAPKNILLTFITFPVLVFIWLGYESLIRSNHSDDQAKNEAVANAKKRLGLVAILTCLISLAIFSIFPVMTKPAKADLATANAKQEAKGASTSIDTQKNQAELTALIQKMQDEISGLRRDLRDRDTALGLIGINSVNSSDAGSLDAATFDSAYDPIPTKTPPKVAYIKIKDAQWQKIDLFEKPSPSSKIVAQAIFGKSYPVIKTDGLFYLINPDGTKNASSKQGWIHAQFIKEYY